VRFVAIRALMALLLFMTLAAWSMGSAVGSSPDEDYVLTSIWCGTEGNPPHCRKDPDRAYTMIVPELVGLGSRCIYSGGPSQSARCQIESHTNDQVMPTSKYNRGNYPNLYFGVHRNLVSYDVTRSVMKMRLLNSLIATLLIFAITSLTRNRTDGILIILFSISAPVAFFIISSVDTSSWAVTSAIGFALAISVIQDNPRTTKTVLPALLFLSISVFLILSSRNEGKFILLSLGALVTIAWLTYTKKSHLKQVLIFLILVLTSILITSSREIRSFGKFLSIRKNIELDRFGNTSHSLLVENILDVPNSLLGFFGFWGLGNYDVNLPSLVWFLLLFNFYWIIAFIFKELNKNLRFIGYGFLGVIPLLTLELNQQFQTNISRLVQPKYLLPFLLGVIILLASFIKSEAPRSLTSKISIFAVIANSVSLRTTLRRYTTGNEIDWVRPLNNSVAWWWEFGPSPEFVWLAGTISFAILLALLESARSQNLAADKGFQ